MIPPQDWWEIYLKKDAFDPSVQNLIEEFSALFNKQCCRNDKNLLQEKGKDYVGLIEFTTSTIGDIVRKKTEHLDECMYLLESSKNTLRENERRHRMDKKILHRCIEDKKRHCCICGGTHINNDHVHHQSQSCKSLGRKQIKIQHQQAIVDESNIRVENAKHDLQIDSDSTNEKKRKLRDFIKNGEKLIMSLQKNYD